MVTKIATPKTPTKNSAKKTSTPTTKKKIAEKKPAPTKADETPQFITAKIILSTWLNGWKKAFVLKGRSSRFELWTFLLINSILTSILHIACYYITSSNYLRSATADGYSIATIETHMIISKAIFYIAMAITVIPSISILIRRMHDVGFLAWKKYLEPISMSFISMWIMFLSALYIEEIDYSNNLAEFIAFIAIVIYVCFIISLYASGYFLLKFLITTLFYQGKEKLNSYGKAPIYNTSYYEDITLNICCIYFLFISTMFILHTILFFI